MNELFYGLIEFTCNTEHGYLLSKPKCFECGVYCPNNVKLLLSCQHFWTTFLLGVFIALLITFVLYKVMKIAMPMMTDKIVQIYNWKKSAQKETRHKRTVKTMKQIEKKKERRNSGISLKSISSRIAASLIIQQEAEVCDSILYLKTVGTVCRNNECTELSSSLVSILYGSTICFKILKLAVSFANNFSGYTRKVLIQDSWTDMLPTLQKLRQ